MKLLAMLQSGKHKVTQWLSRSLLSAHKIVGSQVIVQYGDATALGFQFVSEALFHQRFDLVAAQIGVVLVELSHGD